MNNELWIEKHIVDGGTFYKVMVATADFDYVPADVATCTSESEARAVCYGVEQGLKLARQALPQVRYDARIREPQLSGLTPGGSCRER